MATVIINGRAIEIGDDERLNGIEVAHRAGVEVPHYCWHPGLSVVASCRMCLVETGTRDQETSEIKMVPKLVPACQTPARDGTVFITDSEKVARARAMVEEDLLIDHPIDCPICDKAGECRLQDYHFQYGQAERRADIRPFSSRRRSLGEHVTLFVDRCIMCSRCVRFSREIAGTSELMIVDRGSHAEIDVFPGHPLANKLSGNVVDLCPVGALGDKQFLYRQRVWFLREHAGVCTGCATGCSIHIDAHQDHIYRLRPRENMAVNRWWMCDDGRYGFSYVHRPDRLVQPAGRPAVGERSGHVEFDWSQLPERLDAELRRAGRLGLALAPHLTVEEAYLLAKYVRQIDADAVIALAPVPVTGEDERYPSGWTIHAEKCPNRRGIEALVAHWMAGPCAWDDLLSRTLKGEVSGVWLAGGYPEPWIDQRAIDALGAAQLLVVQDLFDSPVWQQADYRLPAAVFAERSGSYVNHADRLQSAQWAIRPPAGVEPAGRVAWRLLGRSGLYDARSVLSELAAEVAYFSAAAAEIPPTGIDLKVNLLADPRGGIEANHV